jgi:hypothetical protein
MIRMIQRIDTVQFPLSSGMERRSLEFGYGSGKSRSIAGRTPKRRRSSS